MQVQGLAKYNISNLVKTGMNQSFLFSPNTSKKLLYFPKLNPFLSGPVWNMGDLKDSEIKTM